MFREIREKIRLKHRVLNIRGRSLLTPSVRELLCLGSKLHLIASNSYSKPSRFVERRKSYSVVPQVLPFHQFSLFGSLRYSCLCNRTPFRFFQYEGYHLAISSTNHDSIHRLTP